MTTNHDPLLTIEEQTFPISIKSAVAVILFIIFATGSIIAYVKVNDTAIEKCVGENRSDIKVLDTNQENNVRILEDFKNDFRVRLNRIENKLDKLIQP